MKYNGNEGKSKWDKWVDGWVVGGECGEDLCEGLDTAPLHILK